MLTSLSYLTPVTPILRLQIPRCTRENALVVTLVNHTLAPTFNIFTLLVENPSLDNLASDVLICVVSKLSSLMSA